MSAGDEIERALASSDWEERERGVRLAGVWLGEAEPARRERVIAALDALSQSETEKWEVLYALAKALGHCHRDLSPQLDRIVSRLCQSPHGRVQRQAEATRDGWQLQARSEAHRLVAESSVEARLRALRREDEDLAEEAEAIAQERFRLATVEATHDLKHRLGLLENAFNQLRDNMQRLGAKASLWRPLDERWKQQFALTREILNDMQTWAARAEPTLHKKNLRALVNLATQPGLRLFPRQKVRLEVRVSADLWVWVDETLIQRAIENVVKNAFEAAYALAEQEDEPREVRIAAAQRGREVELTIEDEGAGMVRSTLERVFEPGTSSKKGQGRRALLKNTGYGLANARKFVTACAGSIGIESQPGAGTVVTIVLPSAGGS